MQQKEIEDYNARVSLEEGRAQEVAIGAQAERLADEQRETKATQRVRAASAGGGLDSGQNIMILAEEAQKMQMDQLELQRQQQIARTGGKTRSILAEARGKQAMIAGIGQSVSRGAQFAGGMG
jgi:hypothetical protein